MRNLHLYLKTEGKGRATGPGLCSEILNPPTYVTPVLQQSHTYFNKPIPPKSSHVVPFHIDQEFRFMGLLVLSY